MSEREPVLWAHRAEKHRSRPATRWSNATGRREPIVDRETGLPVMEKLPQRAHTGDSDGMSKNPPLDTDIVSFVYCLRHDGHEVFMRLTMGAGDIEGFNFYAPERRAKAQWFGWIIGRQCPLALLAAGGLRPEQLLFAQLTGDMSEEQRSERLRQLRGQACDPRQVGGDKPCDHYYAEQLARQERKRRLQAAKDVSMATEVQKLLKGQSEIQQQATTDIVEGIGDKLAATLEKLASSMAGAGGVQMTPEMIAAIVSEAVKGAVGSGKGKAG